MYSPAYELIAIIIYGIIGLWGFMILIGLNSIKRELIKITKLLKEKNKS